MSASASTVPDGRSAARARTASSVASIVCGLLNKPVAAAVNRLIALMTHGEIKTTLAGQLVSELGFKPLCIGQLSKLETVIRQMLTRPSTPPRLRQMVGPFATGVYATTGRYGSDGIITGWSTELHWTQYDPPYDPSRGIVGHRVELSVNHGPFFEVTGFPITLLRHELVQFAVQLYDVAGRRSPWAYDLPYTTP